MSTSNVRQLLDNGVPIYPITDKSLVIGLQDVPFESYVVAWDGASAPTVANIPAGVEVEYNSNTYTGTLAASSSTAPYLYLVASTTQPGEYDRYITTHTGSTYAWTALGSTEPVSPVIADNLTTNDSSKALSAKQGKILGDDLSQLEAEVQQLMLKTFPGAVTVTTWVIDGSKEHFVIPVNGGEKVTFDNVANSIYCIFLKSYTTPVAGATPDFCTGYEGRQNYAEVYGFTIPTDCRFLVINNPNGNYTLTSLVINGLEVINGVHGTLSQIGKKINDLSQSTDTRFSELQDDIQGELGSGYYKDDTINYGWVVGNINPDGSVTNYESSSYRYSALIEVTPGESMFIRAYSGAATSKAFVFYAQDESAVDTSETGYTKGETGVIQISVPNNAYYIRIQTNIESLTTALAGVYKKPYLLNKSTVEKFGENNGKLDWDGQEVLTETDIATEVISDNLADPSGIIEGKAVNSNGTIISLANYAVYMFPVSPGQKFTFGGFYLGRSGYYSFYNDSTFVSYGAYNDPNGTTNPVSITVPSGVNLLYFTIKTNLSPAEPYKYLQINSGTDLSSYDEFKRVIESICGLELESAYGNGGEIEDLIADLPVSDGSDIQTGYAYINSSTGAVIVKR